MDRRTQQALQIGRVELQRRSVHAGVWFRLLRTLLDELSTPLMYWGTRAPDLRGTWASCGHPVRAGQASWHPFEAFAWPIQTQLLGAAAAVIHLLETGAVTGCGTHAELFLPTPQVDVDAGRLPPKEEPDPWKLVRAALDRAIQAARDHPADAQNLYNLLVIGCRTLESVQRLQADFIALGIPTDTLSFNQGPTPFS